MPKELIEEIDAIITNLDERIKAGQNLLSQVKAQLKTLRGKVNAYKNLKEKVAMVEVSDGDL